MQILKGVILFAVASTANAGYTVYEVEGRHELRNAKGDLVGQYQTHSDCLAALALLPPPPVGGRQRAGTCKAVTHLDWEWNCDGVPKPPFQTFTVFDANGVKYTIPFLAEGETSDYTYPEEPGVRILPNGVEYTFTDIGGLRMNEDGTTDEYTQVLDPYPACWQWKWVRLPDPVPPPVEVGEMPPLEPGALDGEIDP